MSAGGQLETLYETYTRWARGPEEYVQPLKVVKRTEKTIWVEEESTFVKGKTTVSKRLLDPQTMYRTRAEAEAHVMAILRARVENAELGLRQAREKEAEYLLFLTGNKKPAPVGLLENIGCQTKVQTKPLDEILTPGEAIGGKAGTND